MKFWKKAGLVMALSVSMNVGAAPMLRIFELGVQPAKQQAFDTAGRDNLTRSVGNEPGTLAMYAVSPKDDANTAWLFEVYSDDKAYQAHVEGSPYKTYLSKAPGLLTDRRKFTATDTQFMGEKPNPIRVEKGESKPVMRLAELRVKPDQQDAFRRIVLDEMQQSMDKEPGVLAMYAATAKDDPSRWFFVELYQDEAAYQAHRKAPHFQHYLSSTASMVTDKKLTEMTNRVLMSKGGLRYNPLSKP